jgi:hypothetical protein
MAIVNFARNYLESSLNSLLIKTKKKKRIVDCLVVFTYGRFFVTSNASITPTTAIATIMPTIPGKRY